MRKLYILSITGIAFILFSCVTAPDYTAFRESRPRSILVMPPTNQSTDVGAPNTFLATATYPLAEAGYYVIPVTLSSQTFTQNGITVAEIAHELPHSRLRQIFGADAALYLDVVFYGVILGTVQVRVEGKLVDLRTGTEIWSGSAYEKQDRQTNISGFGLLGSVAALVVDQAVAVLTDKSYDVGKTANHQMLSAGGVGPLYGPYHPKYDGEDGTPK